MSSQWNLFNLFSFIESHQFLKGGTAPVLMNGVQLVVIYPCLYTKDHIEL